MIPVLYDNAERAFITNGIGRLSDCISCTVTEERNGIYEVEFEYPITGVRYNDIQEGCIVTVTHDDTGDIQPFDIYGRTAPINGIVTFYAHHVSYRLSDIVVGPCTASSPADALDKIKRNSINGNSFDFWTNKTGSGDFVVEVPDYARALLGGQQGSILDVYGKGDYEFDRWTVKLYLNRGTDSGVEIRYGKNLSDIKHDIDISESYNAVVPYWASSDGDLVMLPEKMLIYSGATSRDTTLTDENFQIIRDENGQPIDITYTITDAKPLDLSSEFQEAPTVEQLRSLAQTKLIESEGWVPDENITVDFVQLWQTEEYADYAPLQRVRLCDTVSVYYPELGVEAVEAKVIKTVYNVLLDRYDSIELGTPQTTLAQAINKGMAEKIEELPTVDMMTEAITRATDLISGGLGGYVYLKPNANGEPEEILIMDSPDINQAVNVIRMNQSGIGFSSNGYSGPFRSAWTIDGSFVADFITAGNLNANLITVGTMLADRIYGGTLKLGGYNNENGLLEVYNASNRKVGVWNNESVSVLSNGEYMSDHTRRTALEDGQLVFYDTNTDTDVETNTGYIRAYSTNRFQICNNQAQGGGTGGIEFRVTADDQTATPYMRYTIMGDGNDVLYGPQLLSMAKNNNGFINLNSYWYLHGVNSNAYLGKFSSVATSSYLGGLRLNGSGNSKPYAIYLDMSTGFYVNSTSYKSKIADTENYGQRLLFCYEMATPVYGDIGSAQLDDDGLCYVEIDDIFAESIEVDTEYQVFLQKEGQGDLWVSEKHQNYFVVQGTAGLRFSWEIKAKQKGFKVDRMEEIPDEFFSDGLEIRDAVGYETGEMYDYELEMLIKEQEEILYETA